MPHASLLLYPVLPCPVAYSIPSPEEGAVLHHVCKVGGVATCTGGVGWGPNNHVPTWIGNDIVLLRVGRPQASLSRQEARTNTTSDILSRTARLSPRSPIHPPLPTPPTHAPPHHPPSCSSVTSAVLPLPTAVGVARLVKLAWEGTQLPSDLK